MKGPVAGRVTLGQAWLPLYYLGGTALFWLIDVILSAPIRAAFIGRPGMRYAYYLGLLGIGIVVKLYPRSGPLLGVLETSTNLLLLVLSIMLPYWSLLDQVETGPLTLPFTPWTFVNFGITGAILVTMLQKHRHALGGPGSRGRLT